MGNCTPGRTFDDAVDNSRQSPDAARQARHLGRFEVREDGTLVGVEGERSLKDGERPKVVTFKETDKAATKLESVIRGIITRRRSQALIPRSVVVDSPVALLLLACAILMDLAESPLFPHNVPTVLRHHVISPRGHSADESRRRRGWTWIFHENEPRRRRGWDVEVELYKARRGIVSTEYPRRSRGVAAARLHGLSTSWLLRRRLHCRRPQVQTGICLLLGITMAWPALQRCLQATYFSLTKSFRRADISPMNRGDAAAGTWIVHGDESRRRAGTLEGRTWAAARNSADPCSVGRRASCLRCRSEPERTPHRYAETKEAILAAADKMRKDGWWAGGATASAIGKKIAKEMLYQMVAQRVGLA